jgi:hypothetical protein
MMVHTTNYFDTFIEVADDCPAVTGQIPPLNVSAPSVATIQFELISQHPYVFTSDEIIFHVYAIRNDLAASDYAIAKKEFFSKGQACLRSSALVKRYGWGIHADHRGKVALIGLETDDYKKYCSDISLKKVKAMRSKKAK